MRACLQDVVSFFIREIKPTRKTRGRGWRRGRAIGRFRRVAARRGGSGESRLTNQIADAEHGSANRSIRPLHIIVRKQRGIGRMEEILRGATANA
jgi:hypothetical protein